MLPLNLNQRQKQVSNSKRIKLSSLLISHFSSCEGEDNLQGNYFDEKLIPLGHRLVLNCSSFLNILD